MTLTEARILYIQGGNGRKLALRRYTEDEILDRLSYPTELPENPEPDPDPTIDLFARLYMSYKALIGNHSMRIMGSDRAYFFPRIAFAEICPNGKYYFPEYLREKVDYVGNVKVDGRELRTYIGIEQMAHLGRVDWSREDFPKGYCCISERYYYCCNLFSTPRWVFRTYDQAKHFVKFFYKELIQLELGDFEIEYINEKTKRP